MRALLSAGALAASMLAASAASAQDPSLPSGQPPPPGMPTSSPPPQNATQADLQQGDQDDSGLGLEWVYLQADGGFSYTNLSSFSQSQLAITSTSKSGGMYGFAAGVRLLFLTLGLRARYHSEFELWQLNADVGLHMRLGRLDPYLAFRGGYDTQASSLNQTVEGVTGATSTVTVHGWNAGLAFGIDYYLAHLISLGVEASGDVLFLTRPPAPAPMFPAGIPSTDQMTITQLYAASGSSVGFIGGLGAHLGIHF